MRDINTAVADAISEWGINTELCEKPSDFLEAAPKLIDALASEGMVVLPRRVLEIIIQARSEGWYEDNTGWDELDILLGRRAK